ncbi:ABC transporter permease [Anaerosporobacter faecicola]|uniref:ABC transporter permease n=1 Tax=Anaerosporobacter faecicola TaxID=2718714 RepID=UPI00143C6136|nr:ABC transporter permease [Anaerosporobacter faecicola]
MFTKQFKKNKVIHITLLLFMILSAFLMTIGSFVILQTTSSMEQIFSVAKPPHFLQMHTGEIDQNKIQAFANRVDYVKAVETIEMVNIDGANIWYEKKGEEAVSLSESMLDNGFVKQTESFDYLLDLDNTIIKQEAGAIGVPIYYMEEYHMAIGDSITITKGDFTRTFIIKNFVRDSQMASSMASSVRFLLSDQDFEEIRENMGEVEYLIEFRLTDSSKASAVQKLYESSDMPVNGQGITYVMIKLVNSLASGLLAGAMIIISIILILIAAFNLRFTILAVLEEEIREIGAMKAIGISNKDINSMYRKKYRMLAAIGCGIGYMIGLFANKGFTKSIRMMLGERDLGVNAILISMVSVLFVYWFMMHLCKKILKRINTITVVQALVYGETGSKKKKTSRRRYAMEKHCKSHVNAYLSIKNLLEKRKAWLLIVVVFFLATNVMLVPMNLIHTVSDVRFANNMGNANCDLWMELQTKDHIEENCEQLVGTLEQDANIQNYSVFSTNKYETIGEDGKETIQVQWGEYSDFPIKCMKGTTPKQDGEIALSYLNQEKLGKTVGDVLLITIDGKQEEYKVTGIYQDMTSGGYTAKAFGTLKGNMVQNYTIYANCEKGTTAQEVAKQYSQKFSFMKVLPMEKMTTQTFGSILASFDKAAYVSIVVALCIGALITVLFLKLQSAKEYAEMATLRVLGFSLQDIRKQYLIKGLLASLIGIGLGILWCNTGCEYLVSGILSIADVGLAEFEFIVNPIYNFVICPVILLVVALGVTDCCAREGKKYEVIKMLQE